VEYSPVPPLIILPFKDGSNSIALALLFSANGKLVEFIFYWTPYFPVPSVMLD
jgi:hypothetical protein